MRTITLSILLVILTCYDVMAQKSYIVHIEKGQSLVPDNAVKNRTSSTSSIKQLCSEPMNLWLVEGDHLSERSIVNEMSDHTKILLIKENKAITLRTNPNDSLYSKQWQYNNNGVNSNGGKIGADINAEVAWDITTGGKTINDDDIVVAVVDNGLDLKHKDIIPNLWQNKFEIASDGIDNDGNGYIDDINGWNAGTQSGVIGFGNGHGTSVSGIVGAKGNNKIGVTGVNWDVKIMAINYGTADEANAIASYAYAYKMRKLYNETNGEKGAFVVATNSSWGIDNGQADEAPLWCAFYDSLGTIGILSMGATANLNVNVDETGDLPTSCNSEYLIAVTNLNKTDTKENSAGYGKKSIDIGAYGAGTYTIGLNNNYTFFGGTSGATPHVCGAVALMYSVKCQELGNLIKTSPSKAALYVKDIVLSTTKPNPSIETITTTGGKLDLGKAITTLHNQCGTCKTPAGIEVAVNDTKATIHWVNTNAIVSLRIRKDGEQNWINYSNVTTDSITIENIDYCTEYEFQLKYNCNGNESEWAYRKYFTTGGCCKAPQAIDIIVNENAVLLKNELKIQSLLEYKSYDTEKWDTLYFKNDLTLSNLKECNKYSMRLSVFCAIQKIYSPVSKTINFNASCGKCTDAKYCDPKNLNNGIEWIDSVQIGESIYFSGNDEDGYGNHIGTILPKAKQGDSVFLKIVPDYSSTRFYEEFTAYADWNQNQVFDQYDQIFKSDTSSRTAVSGYFKIPKDAALGYTRVRIIMSFKEKSPACSGPAQFGEVEDYCFFVEELVGTDEAKLDLIRIYPNPNNGEFVFECNAQEQIKSYTIINAIGEIIDYNNTLTKQSRGQINVSKQLYPGLYSIVVKTNTNTFTKSFVVR